jgi:hypothetical protein
MPVAEPRAPLTDQPPADPRDYPRSGQPRVYGQPQSTPGEPDGEPDDGFRHRPRAAVPGQRDIQRDDPYAGRGDAPSRPDDSALAGRTPGLYGHAAATSSPGPQPLYGGAPPVPPGPQSGAPGGPASAPADASAGVSSGPPNASANAPAAPTSRPGRPADPPAANVPSSGYGGAPAHGYGVGPAGSNGHGPIASNGYGAVPDPSSPNRYGPAASNLYGSSLPSSDVNGYRGPNVEDLPGDAPLDDDRDASAPEANRPHASEPSDHGLSANGPSPNSFGPGVYGAGVYGAATYGTPRSFDHPDINNYVSPGPSRNGADPGRNGFGASGSDGPAARPSEAAAPPDPRHDQPRYDNPGPGRDDAGRDDGRVGASPDAPPRPGGAVYGTPRVYGAPRPTPDDDDGPANGFGGQRDQPPRPFGDPPGRVIADMPDRSAGPNGFVRPADDAAPRPPVGQTYGSSRPPIDWDNSEQDQRARFDSPFAPADGVRIPTGAASTGSAPTGTASFGTSPFGAPATADDANRTGTAPVPRDPSQGRPPHRWTRTAGIVAIVVIVIGLAAGALYYTSRPNAPSYQIGSCVQHTGEKVNGSPCTAPNSFKIVSKVSDPDACPDANDPYLYLDNDKSTVYCLAPN